MHYDAVQDNEREALEAEVNRLALSTDDAAEQFCRKYIEPQLRDLQCNHPQVHWLRQDPVFQPLAPSLAYEWLRDFELMPVSALDTLFEIVAQYGDRSRLVELIAFQSAQVLLFWSPETVAGRSRRAAYVLVYARNLLFGEFRQPVLGLAQIRQGKCAAFQ